MYKFIIFFVLASTLFFSFSYAKDYPGAVHLLTINNAKVGEYTKLAKKVGFVYGKTYSYQEYADVKRENKVGIAGNYDYLLLSTGGNEWDDDAWQKFIKQPCGWETIYYKNHNMTIINETCHHSDGLHSYSRVRLLKLATGMRPNLHLE